MPPKEFEYRAIDIADDGLVDLYEFRNRIHDFVDERYGGWQSWEGVYARTAKSRFGRVRIAERGFGPARLFQHAGQAGITMIMQVNEASEMMEWLHSQGVVATLRLPGHPWKETATRPRRWP